MILKRITGFFPPPREVTVCFTEAVERTCKLIIERARMERAWQEVWAVRDRIRLQNDHDTEEKN